MKKLLSLIAIIFLVNILFAKENNLPIEKYNTIQKEKIDSCMNRKKVSIYDYEQNKKYYICKKNSYKAIEVMHYNIDKKYITIYSEVFLIEKGKLQYAKESQGLIKINPERMKKMKYISFLKPFNFYKKNIDRWICEYQISKYKNKVINYISLGVGKTEDESFNPNEIFNLYNKIMKEIKEITALRKVVDFSV